jgi:hypothetical protein
MKKIVLMAFGCSCGAVDLRAGNGDRSRLTPLSMDAQGRSYTQNFGHFY